MTTVASGIPLPTALAVERRLCASVVAQAAPAQPRADARPDSGSPLPESGRPHRYAAIAAAALFVAAAGLSLARCESGLTWTAPEPTQTEENQ